MSKKFLALLLALVMVFGAFSPVFAEEAKKEEVKTEEKADEKKEEATETKDEAKEEAKEETKEEAAPAELDAKIKFLQDNGYIKGYEGGDLGLDKNITRAEFATLLVRINGAEKTAEAMKTVPSTFTDVSLAHWANGFINVAKGTGIILGYPDGSFKPELNISYAQIATMLDRVLGVTTPNEVYPATYLAKAFAEGIFDGVQVSDHNLKANRADVFKMLYNTITSKKFGAHEIVKGIVLENSRVEKIAKDEIVFEVVDLVQEANWVNANRSSSKKGEQYKYALDKKVADVEDLLGKVVDFTITKDGKIINAKVDDSFTYLVGGISEATNKKLVVNGTAYTAEQDERYRNSEDRLFRTYFNNKAYTYENFVKAFEKTKYNFARVTVKNGKVVFIDGYKFTDIAPVKETKRDGRDVYFYNDTKNGALTKVSDFRRVILFNGEKFTQGSVADIAGDDVIHMFGNKEVIVNKNAKITGKLDKTYTDRYNTEWVVSGEHELYLANQSPFNPVYSFEGKDFFTLVQRSQLATITGREVKMLYAIDGSLQLIDSDFAWSDGIVAIRDILASGKIKFVPAKGDEFVRTEDFGTWYIKHDGTALQHGIAAFDKNDIVYLTSNDENIQALLEIEQTPVYSPASMNYRYITVGAKNYRYFDRLNCFMLDDDGNIQQIADLGKFIKVNAKNTKLEAYVLSELALKIKLNAAKIDTYYYLSDSDDIANTVVFRGAVGGSRDTNAYVVELKEKINYTSEIVVADNNGAERTVKVAKNAAIASANINDIIELRVFKDTEENEVAEGFVKKTIIPFNQATDQVKTYDEFGRKIVLTNDKVYNIYQAVVFGDTNDAYIQYTVDGAFLDVVRFLPYPVAGSAPSVDKTSLIAAKNANNIVIDGTDVYFLNDQTILRDSKGAVKAVGVANILPMLSVGDKVKVTANGNVAVEITLVNTVSELDVAEIVSVISKTQDIGIAAKADNSAAVESAITAEVTAAGIPYAYTLTVALKDLEAQTYNVKVEIGAASQEFVVTAKFTTQLTLEGKVAELLAAFEFKVADVDADNTAQLINELKVLVKGEKLDSLVTINSAVYNAADKSYDVDYSVNGIAKTIKITQIAK